MIKIFLLMPLIFLGNCVFQNATESLTVTPPAADEKWMAIVGDSSVTGAATHPSFKASWPVLLGQTYDLVTLDFRQQHLTPERMPPLTRILYSAGDRAQAKHYGFQTQMYWEGKASTRIDTAEYSFGYLVGRDLGMRPEHIVLVGQNGTMVETMDDQFARIFDFGVTTLPPLVLVSYVANDMCDPAVFNAGVENFAETYREDFRTQLQGLLKYPLNPRGTRIVILEPLDVANILANPDVLRQKILLEGEPTTCGEFRNEQAAHGLLARTLQKILIHECTAILDPAQTLESRLAKVRALQGAQIEVMTQELDSFNRTRAPAGMKIQLAPSVRHIEFQAGDLAEDCFHPSRQGHARIAHQLLGNELLNF